MLPADSSLHRFLNFLRGDADGGAFARVRYYGFRLIMGGIIGFFIVAMATPSRERGGDGFSLGIYLGAVVAGAVLMLAFSVIPRLLHPKDWPTHEEFRRGTKPKKDAADPPASGR
jgi:hypothetical protein